MNEEQQQSQLYQTGYGEIFAKNFLVGFSRALGGVIVQILFFAILAYVYIQVLAPKITPLFGMLEQSMGALDKIQNQQSQTQDVMKMLEGIK